MNEKDRATAEDTAAGTMETTKQNAITNNGDGSVIMQDIAARDITINIASGLPPEVKQKKEVLKTTVQNLVDDLSTLMEQIAPAEIPADFEPPSDPAYSKIKWRKLLQALQHKGCILFVGPEIAINEQGNSLHREFYKMLTEDFDDIEYLEQEGFFTPESDEEILYDVLEYYSKDFPTQNKIGRKLLEQFAQIPFDLILSLCPDDTMRRIFEDYDLEHRFLFYDGSKQEIDTTQNDTVIYNVLGSAAENGRYIFTHEQFYQYLNKIIIPSAIKKKIQDASHFLFIGFDFDKWYNRLLLFILDFEQKRSGGHRLIVGNKKIKVDIEKFIQKQFNITFVDNEYSQFIEWLSLNAAQEGILRNLRQVFVQNNFRALKIISTRVTDDDKLEELLKMEEQTAVIGQKIEQFKKRILN